MFNEGANCFNCAFRVQRINAKCRQCVRADGHPGWELDEGVDVEYFDALTGPKSQKYELIRRVKYTDTVPF